MSVPKAVGIETEYGIVAASLAPGGGNEPVAAAHAVVEQIRHCGPVGAPQRTMGAALAPWPAGWRTATETAPGPESDRASNDDGWMLANGARLYVDHAHPEYCTPECLSPREAVAADKAGEVILERCRQAAEPAWRARGRRLLLYKNNSDHKGNSYGCHENYLLSAELYDDLLERRRALVAEQVLPFLITRTLLSGAGKVGSENATTPAGFQLAQRPDFFETITGLQTTYRRPLFNLRDEAHADRARYRRLHVIVGDANLAEFSTWLKVGTAQWFFRLLEDDWLTQRLELADPLRAWQTVSRDLSFTARLPLAQGGAATALEIQQRFCSAARQYCASQTVEAEAKAVLDCWEATLTTLAAGATGWRRLASRLDWAIKRNLLEKYLAARQSSWQEVSAWQPLMETALARAGGAPLTTEAISQLAEEYGLPSAASERQRQLFFGLRRLDWEYHDLRRGPAEDEMGLFYRMQQRGAVERLVGDEDVARRVTAPPADTRARARGLVLQRFGETVTWADWSGMYIASAPPAASHGWWLHLPDPLDSALPKNPLENT